MKFVVAMHVLNTNVGSFAHQHFRNDVLRIGGKHAVIERRQSDGISIAGRGAQLEERFDVLRNREECRFVKSGLKKRMM